MIRTLINIFLHWEYNSYYLYCLLFGYICFNSAVTNWKRTNVFSCTIMPQTQQRLNNNSNEINSSSKAHYPCYPDVGFGGSTKPVRQLASFLQLHSFVFLWLEETLSSGNHLRNWNILWSLWNVCEVNHGTRSMLVMCSGGLLPEWSEKIIQGGTPPPKEKSKRMINMF